MNFCKAHVSYPFSIFIEMEINIVGKDDMIKTFLITIELFLVFSSAVKVSIVDVLSFYIKNWSVCLFGRNDEVGCTAVNSCRFVCDNKTIKHFI